MTARLAAAVVLGLVACSGAHEYTARGRVVGVDAGAGEVTIDHEDIPGLMGAMTMRFRVTPPSLLATLRPGAPVRFVVRDRAGDLTLVAITATPEP